MNLQTPIQYVKGIGPKTAQRFAKLGVETVGDLLTFYPRNYLDYSNPCEIAQAPFDKSCVIKAEIYQKHPETRLKSGKKLIKVSGGDVTADIELIWFNNPYVAEKLQIGKEYLFLGKIENNFDRLQMMSPIVHPVSGVAPITAIYPQTAGINSAYISRCVANVLQQLQQPFAEPLPEEMLQEYRLLSKDSALRAIHFPSNLAHAMAARRRLIFEELLVLQLGLFLLQNRSKHSTSFMLKKFSFAPFWDSLPFVPTQAQQRACQEILEDLTKAVPMNRLLQGDVGSGKTLVAATTAYVAFQNGIQTALMAPTEILARQHAVTLQNLLEPFGVQIALLTGGMRVAQKRETLAAIAQGQAHLVVGTHAVLSQGVEFQKLGLAIVDEQHRFGVEQRKALAQKGEQPHLLVMSATPIPRTLALLMYGELDISILDQLPPGRTPVKTISISSKKRGEMFFFLDQQIEQGRQVYLVCPLIEESENTTTELKSVKKYLQEIVEPLLPHRRIGLMHGKLKPKEKENIMLEFKEGLLDVLVSTTVIEVGVDVPNANVMVIENAERYGLSALHQLRGRVGRGSAESWCILVSDHKGETARKRLQFLCQTTDGFEIAKYDLENRGPGDFFGKRQHGLPALKLADLMTDTRVLKVAQEEASRLLSADPRLDTLPVLAQQVQQLFEQSTVMN